MYLSKEIELNTMNMRKKIYLLLEQHGVNIFSKNEIEHFESGDNEVCTSDIPTNDGIVSQLKQKNSDD